MSTTANVEIKHLLSCHKNISASLNIMKKNGAAKELH